MTSAFDDLRFILSQLRRDFRFTATCVACLATGMAAVATVFSLVNEVLLKPLPFNEPERLVMVRGANYSNGRLNEQLSLPDYLDCRSNNQSFEDLAAYQLGRIDLPLDVGFERLIGFSVSDNLFDVLRAKPFLGARLNETQQRGNRNQIMLGTSVWRRRFGARPDIVGETIQVNTWANWPQTGSRGFTVVGLLPESLRSLPCSAWFMQRGVQFDSELPYCLPLNEAATLNREFRATEVVGRLKPGISIEQAQADLGLIAARLARQFPDSNSNWTIRVVPLHQHVFGQVEFMIAAVFWAALLILAIGCGNAAHMVLVRFTNRLPNFAIQASVGASPLRLARQIIVESLILVCLALLVAVLLTRGCVAVLSNMAPLGIPRLDSVDIEWSTLAFLTGIAIVCLLVVIGFPLRHLFSGHLNRFLSQASSTSSHDLSSSRFMRHLLVAEVAVSYVLLVACGWGTMRVFELSRTEMGFQHSNRLTMTVSLPQAKHEWVQNTLFCNEILRNARELPGVKNVAAIAGLPTAANQFDCLIEAEGRPDLRPDDLPPGFIRVVTDDYFKTLHIPLLQGRGFSPTDSVGEIGGNRTVLVNKTLVDKCWPNQNPVGRRIRWAGAQWMEVVGVVGDVKSMGVDNGPTSDLYVPEKLFPQPSISIVLHTHGDPLLLVNSVRDVVKQADADALISDIKSLGQVVAESQALSRYALALISGLAIAGFMLALLGVFLTTTYSVSSRRQEFRTRAACGATPMNIMQLIVSHSMFWTMIGLIWGAICVAWLILQRHTFGVSAKQLALPLILIPIPIAFAAALASLLVALQFAFAQNSRR